MFVIGWEHLAFLAFIIFVSNVCVALAICARNATELVRNLRQLMKEVRKFWRK